MSSLVLYKVQERVGYLTLNRPEKHNALSAGFVNEIKSSFRQAEADENCKVIVIDAMGKTFCSGADLESLQKLQQNTFEQNLEDSRNLMELYKMIYTSSKVVIAQVEGNALAGGCGLASVCDFSFAVSHAKFAYTEVRIGFVPAIVMVFLIRKVGEKTAKELLLSGESFTADQAKEMNLINFVSHGELIKEEVFNFAQNLCKNTSAKSLELCKQMINEVQNLTLEESLSYASEMNAKARMTDDCKKGIASFLNKEKLNW